MNDFNDILNHIEIVSTYTRAEAIEDGFLVDLNAVNDKLVKEAGFIFPVAVTRSVWERYIDWTEADNQKQTYQDVEGRLWDMLYMLLIAIKRCSKRSVIKYRLYVIPRDGKTKKSRSIELKSMIHRGDNGEPVITIMLPKED